ncbi:PREDICTED: glucose-fructose oxidoreductase domain-containing protein 1-like [Amphimedon queenslandica]|uniref:Gfo/Idh/MocA-like oxidoreductase C-terminal domain-containing protein n=1 Tax=Amphimedon queenslandica TaxID=400682 RepID=A0A1X7TX67_AMPQE|nr:PREDICTED: glucose-fructose oxidoreductase domain-containing protein 1-like [Amphimedon queenslandica]|eukprot:XP_003389577.1 PREDICTED: glucose-fructose oxidoreductase domain-containing protein 1-like [Amphimedon queenslandica]
MATSRMTDNSLPNVGIIGTPDQITTIIPILTSQGFCVKAIWTQYPAVTKKLAERFSVPHIPPTFKSLLLLHDVDLVYVATEPRLQAEVTVKALTSGKHCVSMEPRSVAEVEKMLSLARYYSQLDSIMETHMRFIPTFTKLKELVNSKHIGKIFTIDVRLSMGSLIGSEHYSWKCDPSLGGGALNLVGSHFIDLIRFLCPLGENLIKQVNCLLHTFVCSTHCIHGYRTIESDDYVSLQMKLSKSVIASVLINCNCGSVYDLEILVNGKEGRAIVRDFDLYWMGSGLSEEKLIFKERDSLSDETSSLDVNPKLRRSVTSGYNGLFAAIKKHYAEGKTDPSLASFDDAHHLRSVLDSARQSHKLSQWVNIPNTSGGASSETTNPFWTKKTELKSDSEKTSIAYV